MDKIPITEKMHLEKEWFADANNPDTTTTRGDRTTPTYDQINDKFVESMDQILKEYCREAYYHNGIGDIHQAISTCSYRLKNIQSE